MKEKAELEQLKTNLENQLYETKKKLNKIFIEEEMPLFEKMYNDTYWKYEEGGLTVYIHAKKVTECLNDSSALITCDSFQIAGCKLTIYFNCTETPKTLGIKITKKQFNNAVSKILNKAKEAIK